MKTNSTELKEDHTKNKVLKIKEHTGWSWDKFAEVLDISKTTLYKRMKKGDWKKTEIAYIDSLSN